MAFKASSPRHFSIIVFGLTQAVIDVEVLRHMVRHEYPCHTFWHTYLGATIVAIVFALAGKSLSQWIKAIWNNLAAKYRGMDLTVATKTTWTASFTGAFAGAYSHILLDSIFHHDIKPLQPWSASNPLRAFINPSAVEIACVTLGVFGLTWFFGGTQKAALAARKLHGGRQTAKPTASWKYGKCAPSMDSRNECS